MINVFCGRENLNKEKFLYNKIFDNQKRAFVIVPDQYSLEAEKQALKYARKRRDKLDGYNANNAEKPGKTAQREISGDDTKHLDAPISLIDLEITTISRLMYDVFSKQGGLQNVYIDKTGREIIISKILRGMNHEDMKSFGSQLGKRAFTTLVGDFISQIKLENLTPADLTQIADSMSEDVEIHGKLHDLSLIFAQYEKAMEGKYTDGEDLYRIFINKIPTSDYLDGADFWFYGFDSFTGKVYDILETLVKTKGANLNIVLNFEEGERQPLFMAGKAVINRLKAIRDEVLVSQIDDSFAIQKPDDLAFLESNLYKLKPDKFNDIADNIQIIKSLNPYYESEACAKHIRELLREKGYRKRDIAIICNEGDNRLGILQRILKDYDIDLFVDDRRPIFKEPFVRYILGILDSIRTGYSTYYILNTIKNPYSKINDIPLGKDMLETYVLRHKIRGTMWKKPFKYIEVTQNKYPPIPKDEVITEKDKEIYEKWLEHVEREKEIKLNEINSLREMALSPFVMLEEIIETSKKEGENIRRFAERFFCFVEKLASDSEIPDDAMWKAIISTLDQIVTLIGDEEFSIDVFRDALDTGLEAVTIGQTPPSIDDLIVGSTQRTRTGPIKALIVLGMNEGVIPKTQSDEGILSNYELSLIAEESKKEKLEHQEQGVIRNAEGHERAIWGLTAKSTNLDREENLAIYRNLSKATENLWISYVSNDSKGNLMLPSELIEDILSMYGDGILSEDVISSKGFLVESPKGTLINLAKYLSSHPSAGSHDRISRLPKQGVSGYKGSEISAESAGQFVSSLAAQGLPEELSAGRTWLLEQGGAMSDAVACLENLREYRYSPQPLEPWLVEGLYGSGQGSHHGSAGTPWESKQGAVAGESGNDGSAGTPWESRQDAGSGAPYDNGSAGAPWESQQGAVNGQGNASEGSEMPANLKLSPSKLENFSRCPFKYFVRYGLKPADGDPIEFKNTDIGSMAHKIIEKFCRKMDRNNSWQELETGDIEREVDALLQEYEDEHLKESFPVEGQERYMARRIREILLRVLREIVDFRQRGGISHSEYEKEFRLVIPSPDGILPSVTIRGTVDRIDYLEEFEDKAFTVVDYKTGKDEFNPANILQGYNLQLFTYLNAIEETTEEDVEGVGVFYIKLRDDIKGNEDRMFPMQGAVIDDMVNKIGEAYIKLNARKPSDSTGRNNVLRETFENYKRDIAEKVSELSKRISEGDVSVDPIKRGTDMDACSYCELGDICRYSDYFKRVIVG